MRYLNSLLLISFYLNLSLHIATLLHASYVKVPVSQHSWNSSKIRICFETSDSQGILSPHFETVKTWAQKEFQKAGIQITGWDFCNPIEDQNSIHVRYLKEKAGWTRIFGRSSAGVPHNINIYQHDRNTTIQDFYYFLPRHTLVHEILHALGFFHEHDRRDTVKKCRSYSAFGRNGHFSGLSLGDYDPLSIMNYCRKNLSQKKNFQYAHKVDQHQARLSTQDITNLKTYMFEPIAEFQPKPKYSSNQQNYKIQVTGKTLTHYRYAIARFGTQDCKKTQNYSSWKPIDQPIRFSLKDRFGHFQLCALGRNSTTTQNPQSYSSVVWLRQPVNFHLSFSQHKLYASNSPLNLEVNFTNQDNHKKNLYIKILSTIIDPRCRGQKKHPWACSPSCLNKKGYEKTNGHIDLTQWAKLYRYQSSGTFKICATENLKDLNKNRFHEETLEVHNAKKTYSTDLYGLSLPLTDQQKLSLIVKSGSGVYTHYRWTLSRRASDCHSKTLSPARLIYTPLEFQYQKTQHRFVCLLLRASTGQWSPKVHVIDLLNPETF